MLLRAFTTQLKTSKDYSEVNRRFFKTLTNLLHFFVLLCDILFIDPSLVYDAERAVGDINPKVLVLPFLAPFLTLT